MTDFTEYKMTEQDIDKVIAYLKTIDPANATPEYAIAYLEQYQAKFHALGHALTDKQMRTLYDTVKNGDLD